MSVRKIDIHDFFIKYLISNGYPENSINFKPVFHHPERPCLADLAIVDPESNKLLAVFEVKRQQRTEKLHSSVRDQLLSYSQAIPDPDVPLIAVFPTLVDNKDLQFEFFFLNRSADNETERLVKRERLPEYKLLKNSRLTKELLKISDEQEQTVDYFQMICWVSAVFVFLALLADILNYFKVDIQRLALIGVIVGLFILPYASKLKILGFEFERLSQIKKGTREKLR